MVNLKLSFRISLIRLLSLTIFVLFGSYTPIYMGSPLFTIIKGVLGNISITTMCIFAMILIRYLTHRKLDILNIIDNKIMIIFFLFGVLLYSSTLGFLSCDIYSLGFIPNIYTLIIFAMIFFIILQKNTPIAFYLLLGYISFYFKFLPTTNLWDYLFDPILWLMSFLLIRLLA